MNSTYNHSLMSTCSLQARVYTPTYLFFKLLNSTYLRLLIGPGILFNILCLLVLSRPRLSNKSTTIVFLRFLALFDILAITLKYLRAEINYQSRENNRDVIILIPVVCKTLYVLMNSSISIAMWIIVLMSLDKAMAVSYPLKASIWLTHKRVSYLCCIIIIILFLSNLWFINLSGIRISRHGRKYCGFNEDSVVVDLLTASILPIALITGANIIIAVILRRISNKALGSRSSDENDKSSYDLHNSDKRKSFASVQCRPSSDTLHTNDFVSATKRRTSVQVTRMLLAVTLSLIICNIPNTIFFVFVKIYDTRQLLIGRLCQEVSDNDINLYKIGFYSSVIQDILSDLPHIFNFFLYCLAGKKFRDIFINEVYHFLYEIHFIKDKHLAIRRGTFSGKSGSVSIAARYSDPRRSSTIESLSQKRKTIEVLLNGKNTKASMKSENKTLLKKISSRPTVDEFNVR